MAMLDKTRTPANCTHFKARKLMRLLSRFYDAELRAAGLSGTQFTVLTHIARRGPIGLGELAERLVVDASTLTRSLRPMVALGWVSISTEVDARRRVATLTKAGMAKQAAALKCWHTAQASVEAKLGPERAAALSALMDESIEVLVGDGARASGDGLPRFG